ncbi:hypothetical protein [Solidesulfovibrio sp.]|uniref:hypothetical protein n=1 Tax=Solidesulfovibrio sp. TaxID=2910990 RepID=UPI002B2105A8|nr:hypothetical protein [Solidesulfovibrio sp.]MEA5090609.1 hypothetical protein [Solidesulfovibrio sp.]
MATPWVDAAAAWTGQAAGFGEGAAAADVAACRAALAVAGATVVGRAGCAAAAGVSPAWAQGHAGTVGWQGRTVARPGAAALALKAPQALRGTGLRAVARLSSPVTTRVSLRSAVAPSVVLATLVAIEQT